MPADPRDVLAYGDRIAAGAVHPDINDWPAEFTDDDRRTALAWAVYSLKFKRSAADRKALRLFASWLSPAQRAEYRRNRCVKIRGSAGGTYRVHPQTGTTRRVELHGSRWFGKASYCYHDPDGDLPKADVALAHVLMIQTDEPGFLAVANEHRSNQLWNGEWLRTCAQMRKRRREAEAGAVHRVPEDQEAVSACPDAA